MSTKKKLLELMNEWAQENINVSAWEDDFLESYTDYHVNNIPDFTPKQEEVIDRMYDKYIEGK